MPAQLRRELKNGERETKNPRLDVPVARPLTWLTCSGRWRPRDPIPIQRWSVRRVAVTAALIAATGLATAMAWTTLTGFGLA